MKSIRSITAVCMIILLLCSCGKRNFYPDPDDPGLSILSSYGFNIASVYINKVPYVNPYKKGIIGGIVNYAPTLRKTQTNSALDTVSLTWLISKNDNSTGYNSSYQNISLLIPVPKSFSLNDFIALSGKRFPANANAIAVNSFFNPSNPGTSNLYFINISLDTTALSFSGLFDGKIGDSIVISKGRFDFKIDKNTINF